MPSLEAQAALIKYVYESNGLDYNSTQYVEAHVCERLDTYHTYKFTSDPFQMLTTVIGHRNQSRRSNRDKSNL
jgi:hypothetical protein